MLIDQLDGLRDTLLVQCGPVDAAAALALANRPGAGVVVSTRRRAELWALAASAADRPMLVDASRYTGARRLMASEPFDPSWLDAQREARLPVMTDSGYVAEGDGPGLSSILRRAIELGDVIATLPLSPWWLSPSGGLPALLEHVHEAGVPIAVAMEHPGDPLGVARTLRGMLGLLDVGVPVIQLRCDLSGLGLMCHGAWAAAVGTRTSLRHLYPIKKRGGPVRRASVATVVRECLSFIGVDKIARAVQKDPENSLWAACTCQVCAGRQLDWIAQLTEREQQERAAFGHALEMLFDLRDHLLRTPADRPQSWRAHCDAARCRYDELEAAGFDWKRPPALNSWGRIPGPTSTLGWNLGPSYSPGW